MMTFGAGLLIGSLISFASIYFFVLRPARDEPEEWLDDYSHLQRELQSLRQHSPSPAPRALTKLTNRERTIEI